MAGNISESVPLLGGFLKNELLAGDEYNEHTLSRFYIIHAAVLPVTMIVLLAVHITFIRLHGVTEFRFGDEPEGSPRHYDFFPDHLGTELMIGLVLMVLLAVVATLFPAVLGDKADPLTTPEVIKPEWFFYVTFRWLKLFSLTAAVLSMGFIVAAMFVWPWIDSLLRRIPGCRDASVYIGIVAALLLIGLTIWEAAVAH